MNACFLRVISRLLLGLSCVQGLAKEGDAFVVIRPVVNLYSSPREDVDVVTQALLASRLVEVERKNDWVRVKGEDNYLGWIQFSALRGLAPGETYPASLEPGKVVETDAMGANIYLVTDLTKRAPLMTAPFGVRLERVNGGKDTQRWIEITLPDKQKAWIQSGDVRMSLAPLSLEASLELARRFMGINYTWGGTSSFGFDCSGFTQTIVRSRGVFMPRDADVQATWSGSVPVMDKTKLLPGDLLFFGNDIGHITHTGMYLSNDSFIHDTTRHRPCVQISDLKDEFWSKLLVTIRRVK